MSSEIINDMAKQFYDRTISQTDEDNSEYGIDPITIIICISIIVNVIRVIQECNKNKTHKLSTGEKADFLSTDIKFRSNNSGFMTRMKIKSILKRHLTREQFKKYGKAATISLLDLGKTVTEEQVSALLEYKNV